MNNGTLIAATAIVLIIVISVVYVFITSSRKTTFTNEPLQPAVMRLLAETGGPGNFNDAEAAEIGLLE
jgi:hypothetical protein